ncbi:hypothetical protein K466DRAFT_583218 [Polyporus arcularius HHB13444]|uniref:Uncharacterized protein n=1 Tax=Polyporus arcularius HHB13444 TaxID=1314778 RepID=A0A5C3PY07_9APHY|nr:hypothetical protein K466DRAFT_583218 [Polyporus arcularius HHB13444]
MSPITVMFSSSPSQSAEADFFSPGVTITMTGSLIGILGLVIGYCLITRKAPRRSAVSQATEDGSIKSSHPGGSNAAVYKSGCPRCIGHNRGFRLVRQADHLSGEIPSSNVIISGPYAGSVTAYPPRPPRPVYFPARVTRV